MPITSYDAFTCITSACKTRISQGIASTVKTCATDTKKCSYYGKRLAINTCKALLLRGVQHIHYYSSNEIDQVIEIIMALGISIKTNLAAPATSATSDSPAPTCSASTCPPAPTCSASTCSASTCPPASECSASTCTTSTTLS